MDLVFSFLVLQHLEREDAFLYLRDAHRVLKPGGRLLTQFPNLLSSEYTRAFLDGADNFPRSLGRVRLYTEPEVRHLLATAGFEVTELWYGGHHADRPAEIYVAATRAVDPSLRPPCYPLSRIRRRAHLGSETAGPPS